MNGIARFVDAGLADAERRIARRLPSPVVDDPWVMQVVESGLLARAVSRVMGIGRAAAASSRAAAIVGGFVTAWRLAGWASRRRAVGLCLLVAATTHGLLVGARHPPAGWLWLILPGVGAVVGLVLLAASAAPSADS